jgi:hypothetical protein
MTADPVYPVGPDYVVGVDYARGASKSTYYCECGFESDVVDEIVAHLKQHGATRVAVSPILKGKR